MLLLITSQLIQVQRQAGEMLSQLLYYIATLPSTTHIFGHHHHLIWLPTARVISPSKHPGIFENILNGSHLHHPLFTPEQARSLINVSNLLRFTQDAYMHCTSSSCISKMNSGKYMRKILIKTWTRNLHLLWVRQTVLVWTLWSTYISRYPIFDNECPLTSYIVLGTLVKYLWTSSRPK